MRVFKTLAPSTPLIDVDGETLYIDTGAMASVDGPRGSAFLRLHGVSDGREHSLFRSVAQTVLHLHPGTTIDALVGVDVLSQSDLLVGLGQDLLAIGRATPRLAQGGRELISSLLLGLPVIQTRVGGRNLRLALDTGCNTGYLLQTPQGGIPAGNVTDRNPMAGEFTSPTVRIDVALLDRQGSEVPLPQCRLGVLPSELASELRSIQLDGVIGRDVFQHHAVLFTRGLASVRLLETGTLREAFGSDTVA